MSKVTRNSQAHSRGRNTRSVSPNSSLQDDKTRWNDNASASRGRRSNDRARSGSAIRQTMNRSRSAAIAFARSEDMHYIKELATKLKGRTQVDPMQIPINNYVTSFKAKVSDFFAYELDADAVIYNQGVILRFSKTQHSTQIEVPVAYRGNFEEAREAIDFPVGNFIKQKNLKKWLENGELYKDTKF